MKILAGAVAAAACLMAVTAHASPHGHRHSHELKERDANAKVVPEIVYSFQGTSITESEVCKGINNGTFVWAAGTTDKPDCANFKEGPLAPPSPSAKPLSSSNLHSEFKAPDTQKASDTKKAPDTNKQPSAPAPDTKTHTQSDSGSHDSSEFGGDGDCDQDFQDGVHDCSEFPSNYGAVKVPWMEIGGWSGVQATNVVGGVVGNIDTAISGGGCKAGTYCSYACPPGYQKSQWPEQNSGTSVGGLKCGSDNKLYLSNPSFKKICIKGTEKVDVQNKLSKNCAICRTDYPGTESETIPLNTQPGQKYPLTCPDASSYYKHLDTDTSAQYYVNMAGVEMSKACSWGQDETGSGNAYGNWASVNIGVGTNSNGATFISLLSTEQNKPNKIVPLGFNIEVQGDLGGSACMYIMKDGQGQFCSSGTMSNPQSCKPHGQFVSGAGPVPGCTVQVFSGKATYVLTDA